MLFYFLAKHFRNHNWKKQIRLVQNFKAMLSPVFIFLFFCMALTAISEFGPNQWVSIILVASGAEPLLILALTFGVAAIGRWFAGPVVGGIGPDGCFACGAILTAIGIYMFSTVTGPMAYVAAIIYALGICYFWPVMIGSVAHRVPKSSALGMSIVGGVGMFSTSIFQPIIGGWIDSARAKSTAEGLTGNALELATGQDALMKMLAFPVILIVLFTIFFFWQKNTKRITESEMTMAMH